MQIYFFPFKYFHKSDREKYIYNTRRLSTTSFLDFPQTFASSIIRLSIFLERIRKLNTCLLPESDPTPLPTYRPILNRLSRSFTDIIRTTLAYASRTNNVPSCPRASSRGSKPTGAVNRSLFASHRPCIVEIIKGRSPRWIRVAKQVWSKELGMKSFEIPRIWRIIFVFIESRIRGLFRYRNS